MGNRRTLYVTVGVPLSGKTTWVEKEIKKRDDRAFHVSYDGLRERYFGNKMFYEGYTKTEEMAVVKIALTEIDELLKVGNVYFDATNLHNNDIKRLRELAKSKLINLVFKVFDLPSKRELFVRNNQRFGTWKYIPERVLTRMIKNYSKISDLDLTDIIFESGETHTKIDKRLEKGTNVKVENGTILVDLDGTLALMDNRDPYSTTEVINDVLNHSVADVVRKYESVIFLSGRSEDSREATESWLANHGFKYEKLLMRGALDRRADSIVKEELYLKHIKDKYNVLFVLDDRDVVVNMWRDKLNLNCFQVYYGNF